ncbi:MAG: excinuclease ABC subunit UvrA [candidate division WOR-3 bacterium]
MEPEFIKVRGARQHNLKNIDLDIPRGRFIVITGLSGSGKSSLAFDTLYAEGQRRYVESLSAYARQFLGLMEKPDLDYIEGLSPAIAIEQRKAGRNPRSTVATVTELYDYLRLLFARIGKAHCPKCGLALERWSTDEIIRDVLSSARDKQIAVLAPVVRGRKGEYRELLVNLEKRGYVRARIDGDFYLLEEAPHLERYKQHTIEAVVDRLVLRGEDDRPRLAEAVETALRETGGLVTIVSDGSEKTYSEKFSCPACGFSLEEMEPRLFSFNSPYGACPTCDGLGVITQMDPDLIVGDPELSILEGAIRPWGEPPPTILFRLEKLAARYRVDLECPWNELPENFRNIILYGVESEDDYHGPETPGTYPWWEGVIPWLWRRYQKTESDWVRREIERYMVHDPCSACGGARLRPEALAVRIGGINIYELTLMDVGAALRFLEGLELSEREAIIARQIIKEIKARLGFLSDVGLGYLTLERPTETLSGGEEQRVRLATQIGSGLTGVLYILDEPSIGLHPRDTGRLIATLQRLRDLGNTVIVVEHDEGTIRSADWVIDLGPGAGDAGGKVIAEGNPQEIAAHPDSLTGKYLSGRMSIPVPKKRKRAGKAWLIIRGARANNLKNIDVRFPIGLFSVVTGVSGSGKSSLITDTLYRALRRHFYGSKRVPGDHDAIEGLEHIDKVVNVDQSPIGRTPRSNPATYTGLFTSIRELFASLPEARARGYTPGRFSFNVKGGRCEACQGDGYIRIEMQFLPDVYVPCEVCHGKRYNEQTLEVRFKGKSIADVLEMSVDEATVLFKDIPRLAKRLNLFQDVGLGYIRLGQPATTLSGGEAQRVKLSKELSRTATGQTLYILDEPTTGLHFHDVAKLIDVLLRLRDMGNTIIVVEHQPDVVKSADWIVDLGPEGGEEGGYLVAEGTPEDVALCEGSYTGQYLTKLLGKVAE